MTEICPSGSATANPCTNVATVETHFGAMLCAPHARLIELGWEAEGWLVAESLLEEAIEQAEEVGLPEGPLGIIKRAREAAAVEAHSLELRMIEIKPERG